MELDRNIHEPARLRILMILSGVDVADFAFLHTALGLTKGNLSSHMDRLEKAGYVTVTKSFNGKIPHTDYQLTKAGRKGLAEYWAKLDAIRSLTDQAESLTQEISGADEDEVTGEDDA